MDTRRDILKKLGAAVAAGSTLTSAAPAMAMATPTAGAEPLPAASLDAPPWTLLAPYVEGSAIGSWSVSSLSAVRDGATVVTLAGPEGSARVHVCGNDGAPLGLAHTDRFDLLLMNGGDGGRPSQEQVARVLAVLVDRIDANTTAALAAHPELATLMPHSQRVAAFRRCGREVLV